MTRSETITGEGMITRDGKELGRGRFRVTTRIAAHSAIKRAEGTVHADAMVLMQIAANGHHVTMQMDQGQKFDFVIPRYSFMSSQAAFLVSGPVPGMLGS